MPHQETTLEIIHPNIELLNRYFRKKTVFDVKFVC